MERNSRWHRTACSTSAAGPRRSFLWTQTALPCSDGRRTGSCKLAREALDESGDRSWRRRLPDQRRAARSDTRVGNGPLAKKCSGAQKDRRMRHRTQAGPGRRKGRARSAQTASINRCCGEQRTLIVVRKWRHATCRQERTRHQHCRRLQQQFYPRLQTSGSGRRRTARAWPRPRRRRPR